MVASPQQIKIVGDVLRRHVPFYFEPANLLSFFVELEQAAREAGDASLAETARRLYDVVRDFSGEGWP